MPYKKNCRKCGTRFRPTGKFQYLCDKCLDNARKRNNKEKKLQSIRNNREAGQQV
jgi:hypothetical protein